MNLELIEELYNLIQTNDNNLMEVYEDKFKEFYNDRASFVRYLDFEPKIYYILEYMIKNSKGLIFEYEIGNLLSLFNDYMEKYLQVYAFSTNENLKKDNAMISKIFELFIHYNIIKDIISNEEYYSKLNVLDKSEVNKLLSKSNIRDFVCAFIMVVNYGFFDIDSIIIKQVLDFIRNNSYIEELYDKKLDDLDKNYIHHYFEKFIFIKDFSTKEELISDKMIISFLKGKIKNRALYLKLIKTLDTDILLEIYNNDLDKLFNDLHSIGYGEVYENQYKQVIFDKLLEDKPLLLFEYYYKHKDGDGNYVVAYYIEKETYIVEAVKDEDISLFKEEILLFLLKNYPSVSFILNFCNYYNNKDVTPEIQEQLNNYNFYKEIYPKEKIVELLRNVFNGKKTINESDMINLCYSLTYYITNTNVRINFFANERKMFGYFDKEKNTIGYAFEYYSGLRGKKQDTKLLFDLLVTIFHESTHYNQFNNIPTTDEEIQFYKEKIIRKYYPNYYEKNYSKISYERDARLKSYELCYKFLEENIPELCESFKAYFEQEYKEDVNLPINEKIVFDENIKLDIDRIFDRLLFFHPEIKEEYPLLFHENKSKT